MLTQGLSVLRYFTNGNTIRINTTQQEKAKTELTSAWIARNLRKSVRGIAMEDCNYVDCQNCKNMYDCKQTYLCGCTDGEEWCEEKENYNE